MRCNQDPLGRRRVDVVHQQLPVLLVRQIAVQWVTHAGHIVIDEAVLVVLLGIVLLVAQNVVVVVQVDDGVVWRNEGGLIRLADG